MQPCNLQTSKSINPMVVNQMVTRPSLANPWFFWFFWFFSRSKQRSSFISFVMNNNNSVVDIITSALKALNEGNYKPAIALVEPLLKGKKKKMLSPEEEQLALSVVGKSYEFLGNFKAALPHAKRYLE